MLLVIVAISLQYQRPAPFALLTAVPATLVELLVPLLDAPVLLEP